MHRRTGGPRRWSWLTVRPGGLRRAAHSCGSAPVLHRLPPPRRRDPPGSGTARTIRGCARPLSSGHPRGMRSADSNDRGRGTPSPGSSGRSPAAASRAARAEPGLRRARDRRSRWLIVEVHAPDGPYRRAFPALLALGVVFALFRVALAALTTHNGIDVLVTLPHVHDAATCSAASRSAARSSRRRAPGARRRLHGRRDDGGVRRVQRDRVALRARAVDAARVPRARCRRDRRARVRPVDDRVGARRSAKPTAPAPAAGRSAAAGSCASIVPVLERGHRTRGRALGVDGRARLRHPGAARADGSRRGLVRARRAARARPARSSRWSGAARTAAIGLGVVGDRRCSSPRRCSHRAARATAAATATAAWRAADWAMVAAVALAPARSSALLGLAGERLARLVREPVALADASSRSSRSRSSRCSSPLVRLPVARRAACTDDRAHGARARAEPEPVTGS